MSSSSSNVSTDIQSSNTKETNCITNKATIESSTVSPSHHSSPATVPVCKYFLSKRSCPYGSRCRFRHASSSLPRERRREVCQHYLSSRCRYGDRCKFLHVGRTAEEEVQIEEEEVTSSQLPLLDTSSFPSIKSTLAKPTPKTTPSSIATPTSVATPSNVSTSSLQRERGRDSRRNEPLKLEAFFNQTSTKATAGPPASRPFVSRPKVQPKTGSGQQQSSVILRDVEIEQLKKRYPGDQHQLVEKSNDSVTYVINFCPTDPEWVGGKLPSFDLKIMFPSDYPCQPCRLQVVGEGLFPPDCTELINAALEEQVNQYHKNSRSSGQYDLMLRPILHWLDRHVMSLIDNTTFLEKFLSQVKGKDETTCGAVESEEHAIDDDVRTDSKFVAPVKRGTELRLVELRLSDSVATVQMTTVKMTMECIRCKSHHDILCKGDKTIAQLCCRCHQSMAVTLHPDLLHASNNTLAFLDLSNCKPVDLIISSCEAILSCVECGREQQLKGWSFGQPLTTWCHSCHVSLTVGANQCRFVAHQPGQVHVDDTKVQVITKRKKEAEFREGKPLPDTGTCHHYKKSHRWLRFPCCGKAYPCDVCHDSNEDHPMERANRMICGYCSREQVYNGIKPCTMCGSELAHTKSSTYWEGGQGCRDKVKMSRNDSHKYSQSKEKTTSMKSERVGAKGKANVKKQ